MLTKRTVRKITEGDRLDTSSGPAEVIAIGHDPFNQNAITLTIAIGEATMTVGSFRPNTKLNVYA